jgi:hypothetical protein
MTGFSSNLTISIFIECWRVAYAANAGINGARRLALTRAARRKAVEKKRQCFIARAASRAQSKIGAII